MDKSAEYERALTRRDVELADDGGEAEALRHCPGFTPHPEMGDRACGHCGMQPHEHAPGYVL